MNATKGERCHDATVAAVWTLARTCTSDADQRRCRAWRDHVVNTRPERVARIDKGTFDWPIVRDTYVPPPDVGAFFDAAFARGAK